MNRTYELMFIVRPDMAEEEQDKLISTLETAVTSSGGNVKSVEKMGKRRLAYMVRRFHDGIYMLLTVEGGGGLIHELERRLRVTEPVIKFITVRIDEEQKRLDKIKAIRDAKRKTPPPPRSQKPAGKPGSYGVKPVVGPWPLVVGITKQINDHDWSPGSSGPTRQRPKTKRRF